MEEIEGEYRLRGNGAIQSATCSPCAKGVEWGLGTRGLRTVAAFWAGIPVEVIQEAGVVPRCIRATMETPFWPYMTRRETVGVFYPLSIGGLVRV